MRPLAVVSLLCAAAFAGEIDREKALAEVRELQESIIELVERVAPTVGAVGNHHASFDEKSGRVALRLVGLGSGCTISRDGFFLTNVHVVANAARITVSFNDGKTYEATLFADTSAGTVKGDIALLQLHGQERWPHVDYTKGDVRKLDPGSFVFAMGNPYGHAMDGTPVVTMGVVSGTGRAAAETGYFYLGAVQTDVEINPGNSGGPLFDARGRFVGINGLMQSRRRGSNSGVGFAIPVNQVRTFLDQLMRKEGTAVSYGYHGLRLGSNKEGALVYRSFNDSPAIAAGVRPGDVIIKVNGKRVENRSDFVNVVGQLPAGRLVRLMLRRGSNTKQVSFKLADQPERGTVGKPLPLHERAFLGAEWKNGETGVELTRVVKDAAAARAGLVAGDLLIRVGKQEIHGTKQLADLLSFLPSGHTERIQFRHEGRRQEANLTFCDAAEAAGVKR